MSLFWSRYGTWTPQGGEYRQWRDLRPGDLVVIRREVWRVHEVRPVPVVDWDEQDREYFRLHCGPWDGVSLRRKADRCVSEEEWEARPVYLVAFPAKGGKRHHVKVRPYVGLRRGAYVLHPHYPVCRECGEPWPCRELDIHAEVEKQSAEIDRLEAVMPGCCWNCGEPVTARQKSVVFDGENLLLPGAAPAVFHLRRGKPYCHSAAVDYEKKLVAAHPERHPTLYCTGNLIIHVDGAECSEDPFCPGPQVGHPSWMNHRAHAGYVRRCLRCKDACAQMGITVPEGPGEASA